MMMTNNVKSNSNEMHQVCPQRCREPDE